METECAIKCTHCCQVCEIIALIIIAYDDDDSTKVSTELWLLLKWL